MSDFRLVYAGFDKLDAAFQGAMAGELFPLLNATKEAAQRENEPFATTIGPQQAPVHVHDRGMRGGYAWHLSTGPIGANYFIKEDVRTTEWNLFMASFSSGLMAFGYRDYWNRISETMKGMGAVIVRESLNRVDFAMDFATSGFELDPNLFVAPPRTKRPAHYGEYFGPDEAMPQILTAGRRVQSVTIGRMPGRQIIVYDKRAEATAKNNWHWFEAWKIDPKDKDTQVWRVEVRAGKKHLKQDFGISTFQSMEESIGDVFSKMAQDVRYLESVQSDRNISRARLHPLWSAVQTTLKTHLTDHVSGLLPGRVIEIEREKQRTRYIDNISGNAAALAVVEGRSFENAFETLPADIAKTLAERFEASPRKLAEKMALAGQRYHFL
jgi:hypothetical protein